MKILKNQKQAGIAKKKIEDLKKALLDLESKKDAIEPAKFDLQHRALIGLIKELELQLLQYNALKEGNFNCIYPETIHDLPAVLIAARLAQNLSHEALGELIEVKGQQIQRYEDSDYKSASFERIREIIYALNLKIEFLKVSLVNAASAKSFMLPKNCKQEYIERTEALAKRNNSLLISN